MVYVWPDLEGENRGLSIEPLHINVPKAVRKDEQLYKLLASVDVLRVGRVREMNMAIEELKKDNEMSERENTTRIKVVREALQELAAEVVFVGGATVALYADRPAGEARPTDDMDILVELAHHREYAAIEEKLRAKGFTNEVE